MRVGQSLLMLALPMAALATWAPVTAETTGRARVALPFVCAVDQRSGQLIVQPSVEQTYEIVDRREVQRFSACRHMGLELGDERCRTYVLHKFTMQCGANR